MRLIVNGETLEVAATTLDAALVELGYKGAKLATAVNEEFVPAALRGSCAISDGDRIEIVAPRQGG